MDPESNKQTDNKNKGMWTLDWIVDDIKEILLNILDDLSLWVFF